MKSKFLTLYLLGLVFFYSCGQVEQADRNEVGQTATAEAKEDKEGTEVAEKTKTIVFFGNSLTAGYGLEPDLAFPALIQQRIDSLGLPYKTVNAGVSGETSAGGKSRVDWILKQPVDVFVLELGANDGLRGINPTDTYRNLGTIIDKVRAKNPDVDIILAGMQIPPSMGQQYAKEFSEVYTRLAKEKNVALIPFLLEGVAGDRQLNQGDGIHPTEEGQQILAKNTWQVLEPILKEQASS